MIHDKIRALLAKGRSTDNVHEATAFLEKARGLLEKHSLKESDLDAQTNPLSRTMLRLPYNALWYRGVASEAATYFGACAVIHLHSRVPAVEFFGREAALETTLLMVPYLWQSVVRAGNSLGKSRYGRNATPNLKRQCIAEVGEALTRRLMELHAAQPAQPSGPGALVPISEAAALRDQVYGTAIQQTKHLGRLIRRDAAREADAISLHLQTDGAVHPSNGFLS